MWKNSSKKDLVKNTDKFIEETAVRREGFKFFT